MVFDTKQKYTRHKARLVVRGHMVDSSEHTTYSSTIKDTSIRLMLMIEVKNGLGLMDGDTGNEFCTATCAETFGLHVVNNLMQNLVFLLF